MIDVEAAEIAIEKPRYEESIDWAQERWQEERSWRRLRVMGIALVCIAFEDGKHKILRLLVLVIRGLLLFHIRQQ